MPALIHRIAVLNSSSAEIGAQTYNFQSIAGVPEFARRRVETFQRDGEDGTGFRDLGSMGKSFVIEAVEFAVNRTIALATLAQYQALIGSGAEYGVHVYEAGVLLGTFAVLDVRLKGDVETIDTAVGSLVVNPTALMTTEWELHS